MTRTPRSAATASDALFVMTCRLSNVNSLTRPQKRDSCPDVVVRLRSAALRSPALMPALNTSPAQLGTRIDRIPVESLCSTFAAAEMPEVGSPTYCSMLWQRATSNDPVGDRFATGLAS